MRKTPQFCESRARLTSRVSGAADIVQIYRRTAWKCLSQFCRKFPEDGTGIEGNMTCGQFEMAEFGFDEGIVFEPMGEERFPIQENDMSNADAGVVPEALQLCRPLIIGRENFENGPRRRGDDPPSR